MRDLYTVTSAWLAELPPLANEIISLAILLTAAVVVAQVFKRVVVKLLKEAARHTRATWDDLVLEYKVFDRLVQVVPALLIYFGARLLPGLPPQLIQIIGNLSLAYIALMVTLAVGALLSAVNAIYSQYPISRDRPIKGFIQITKIFLYVLGGVVIFSILLAKSPAVLLTGFGAMTAILLLIFRDTILALVASVQMSSLDMVRVGDWIEMPLYNADGEIVDVALHTIKVQNWDKTFTMIPTHKLISESFKNWRGMKETGGRRIKRSINFDVNTVRFLSEAEVDKFREFRLLQDYIERRKAELAEYNRKLGKTANVNLRRLTNFGTFRAYLLSYLENHPRIRQDMTLMVRQLQPTEAGMPLEIYCFTATTDWSQYEGIQADIFDHILAHCAEFGLAVFQSPTGQDFRALAGPGAAPPVQDDDRDTTRSMA